MPPANKLPAITTKARPVAAVSKSARRRRRPCALDPAGPFTWAKPPREIQLCIFSSPDARGVVPSVKYRSPR